VACRPTARAQTIWPSPFRPAVRMRARTGSLASGPPFARLAKGRIPPHPLGGFRSLPARKADGRSSHPPRPSARLERWYPTTPLRSAGPAPP
jgi:hypothetical protein